MNRRAIGGQGVLLSTLLLTMIAVLLGGCAPQLDRIEVAVQENRDEIALLQTENKQLLQEVRALGQLLRLDRESGDESSVMRLTRLTQLSTQIDQLLRRLEDNSQYMRDLSARVDLLATRAGIPTLGEYKPPNPGVGAGDVLTEEGRSILQAAELDRNRGNIELARQGFEEFLTRFGSSEAADDALYWLGDLAYGEAEYEEALRKFRELLERFPASERAPGALFKSRSCLLALGRDQEGWVMGGELLAKFPASAEADLLQAELAEE